MRVLQINSVCGIRSTGRICTDIADILTANGHECKIAYGREIVPEKYQKYAVRIGSDFGVKLHALQARFFDNAGFGSKQDTDRFIEWAKEYNPDVIHLHNIHGYYINVEVLFNYLKTCGKKVIWTLHDCWAFTGHCAYFDFIGCDKWKYVCCNCTQKYKYPASVLFDNSKNNYLKKKELFTGIENMIIVTPSQWLAKLVKQSYLREYPVEIIRNGIDLNVFKPTPGNIRKRYHIEDKKIILGVASAWDERKGLDDFVELAPMLDRFYQIVLIGLSEKQLSKLPKNIIGIKRTNNVEELAEWYTIAEVFLNLTYEDNYPTVNLEAQACGTPVITYMTGGSIESVVADYWISKGNLRSVYNALKHVNADNYIRDVADKLSCTRQYINIYRGNIF